MDGDSPDEPLDETGVDAGDSGEDGDEDVVVEDGIGNGDAVFVVEGVVGGDDVLDGREGCGVGGRGGTVSGSISSFALLARKEFIFFSSLSYL